MVRDFPHMKSSSFFPRKIRGTANTHTHTHVGWVQIYICRSSRLNDASKPYHTGATCSCKTAMELPWPHCDDPTPRPGRSQMCEFQPTKGSFSFKVGSISCDPDCPYCTCVVYPNNSVRNWSCELEDGFV